MCREINIPLKEIPFQEDLLKIYNQTFSSEAVFIKSSLVYKVVFARISTVSVKVLPSGMVTLILIGFWLNTRIISS